MQDTLTTAVFDGLALDDARRIYDQAQKISIKQSFPRDVTMGSGGSERVIQAWKNCARGK